MYKLPLLSLCFVLLLAGCDRTDQPNELHGYVEARLTYIAPELDGELAKLHVSRGDNVQANQILFQLSERSEQLRANSANAALLAAKAKLANLQTGKRPSEIAAIQQDIEAAKADLEFAQKELKRNQELALKKHVDQNTVDAAYKNMRVAEAQLAELNANLDTAQLPARTEEINAARAAVAQAQAELLLAQKDVHDNIVKAPQAGRIFDTYYQVGEQVPVYQPVLALLVPDEIHAIFFVSEAQLSTLKLGQTIQINCDSCGQTIAGKINYISPEAEYTPPVIYSRKQRAKLVYRVEAALPQNHSLHPGQPIDIMLEPAQS